MADLVREYKRAVSDPEIASLRATIEERDKRIADLERALWVALYGSEVVVRDDTPRAVVWSTTEDGGRMVRRARQS